MSQNVRKNMLLLLFAALPVTASPLSITVEVDPPSALPGIPVSLILTVENTSDVPQTVPSRTVLIARPASGERFIPDAVGVLVKAFPYEYRDERVLRPGQKRAYEIPLATALTDGAMADPRLWKPGTYQLQLFLHDDLRDDDVDQFGLDELLGAGRISSPLLVSPEATLRVEKPTGVDAEIWTMLLDKTQGRGLLRNDERASDTIAKELWSRAAKSPYMPYLIPYMRYTPRPELKDKWRQLVEADPNHPVAEAIRLGNAEMKALEAETAIFHGGDLDAILSQSDEARAELATLAKDARHDLIRVRARHELTKLKSRERLTELYREVAPNH